jgi:predicted ATPase
LEAEHLCEQGAAIAEEGGFVSYMALTRCNQGLLASAQGKHERSIALIRSGIDWGGLQVGLTALNSTLAEVCLRAGRYQEAMDAVAAGREHAARTGEHGTETEVERVAGETLILMDAENATEAEQCFRRAISIAAEQGAKSFELRAATSLARLLRQQGRIGEARDLLAPVYNWFSEGFETADLKNAKALLGELGA